MEKYINYFLSRGPLGTAASSTCNLDVQGGEWCNVNKNNCEVGCSGKWCTNMMPLTTMKPTTKKPTTIKPTTRKPTNKALAPTKKPTKKPTIKPLASTRKPTSLPTIKPTTRTPTVKKPSMPPSQTTCNDSSGDYCTKIYCCKWTKNANVESCAYTEPSTGERGINNNCCPCLPTPTTAPAVKTCNIFGQVCTQESDCCDGFYCWISAGVCFPDYN